MQAVTSYYTESTPYYNAEQKLWTAERPLHGLYYDANSGLWYDDYPPKESEKAEYYIKQYKMQKKENRKRKYRIFDEKCEKILNRMYGLPAWLYLLFFLLLTAGGLVFSSILVSIGLSVIFP